MMAGNGMIRVFLILSLIVLAGCADQSRGVALNECRQQYYLQGTGGQAELIPDCMRMKSFQPVAECQPEIDEHAWDWTLKASPFNNPRCYRPLGAKTWIATTLSPM